MRLTPSERDRILVFNAAELARRRLSRGLQLNVPEATAIIADTVIEAARDGARLLDAARAGQAVLDATDVLPGVASIVTEVKVEAVFDDGTRLVVVRDPFRSSERVGDRTSIEDSSPAADHGQPGEVLLTSNEPHTILSVLAVEVINTADVPISVTSHFHFFEVNPRLRFPRRAGYGMRLAIPAGEALRFDPGVMVVAPLAPIGGARIAIGFAGLVDGPLDDDSVRQRAYQRASEQGFLGMDS